MNWIKRTIGRITGNAPAPLPREVKPLPKYDHKPPLSKWLSLDGNEIPQGARLPRFYLVKDPDGRITTPDGEPATIIKSSDMLLPSDAGDFPKPRWDKDGKFVGWST